MATLGILVSNRTLEPGNRTWTGLTLNLVYLFRPIFLILAKTKIFSKICVINFLEFQGVMIRTRTGSKSGPVGGPVGLIQIPVDVSFCRNNAVDMHLSIAKDAAKSNKRTGCSGSKGNILVVCVFLKKI